MKSVINQQLAPFLRAPQGSSKSPKLFWLFHVVIYVNPQENTVKLPQNRSRPPPRIFRFIVPYWFIILHIRQYINYVNDKTPLKKLRKRQLIIFRANVDCDFNVPTRPCHGSGACCCCSCRWNDTTSLDRGPQLLIHPPELSGNSTSGII
jgi:hypothetical protein